VRSRTFVVVALVIVGLFAGAGAMLAYDSSQSDQIASGVSAGGVDIGGLSASQARARLRDAYRARLGHPIVLTFGRRRFVLQPKSFQVTVDVDGTVAQAISRSRSDNIFVRVYRSLTGGRINANVDPQVSFSQQAVDRLVGRVTHQLDQPAHSASISYGGDSIGAVQDQPGIAVRSSELSAAIDAALIHANAPRRIRIPVGMTHPKVTTRQLASAYPTIITVDRSSFRLRLWKHLRLMKTYTIAVGMAGLDTPAGLYHVQDKEVDPSWHVPNSSWAGSLAGQTIPPGPSDPLKARWMGIFNGAGIHGTDALDSLGSAASHGCIRMAISDVIELYDQTPLGAPVYIA
jgi:lipoprotein-anchoring transpeptidase ErfK/SrfK